MIDLRREQQYQKVCARAPRPSACVSAGRDRHRCCAQEQEELFRDTSEGLNARVVWFILLQVAVLIATSAVQLRHLTVFFHAKKVA
jgi:hypothetical protein